MFLCSSWVFFSTRKLSESLRALSTQPTFSVPSEVTLPGTNSSPVNFTDNSPKSLSPVDWVHDALVITLCHVLFCYRALCPADCRGWYNMFLRKETDLTFTSRGKSKSPKTMSCGRAKPFKHQTFQARSHLYQDARVHHSCCHVFKTPPYREGLGICPFPTGLWCTVVWLRSLGITKCSKPRCASSFSCCPIWSIWWYWVALGVDARIQATSR